jgi:hypothetical protein
MVGEDGKPVWSHLALLINGEAPLLPTIRSLLSRRDIASWASTVRRRKPREVSIFSRGLATKYAPFVLNLESANSIVKPDDMPIVCR